MKWWQAILDGFRPFMGYGPQFLEERPWVKRWRKKRQRKKAA